MDASCEERTWTVRIGVKESMRQYRDEFASAGIRTTHFAERMMRRMPLSPLEQELRIAVRSGSGLGQTEHERVRDTYARAARAGSSLCPAEAALALRIAYRDQPEGECLYVGMKSLGSGGGYDEIFALVQWEGEPWLTWSWTESGPSGLPALWAPGHRRVYLLGDQEPLGS